MRCGGYFCLTSNDVCLDSPGWEVGVRWCCDPRQRNIFDSDLFSVVYQTGCNSIETVLSRLYLGDFRGMICLQQSVALNLATLVRSGGFTAALRTRLSSSRKSSKFELELQILQHRNAVSSLLNRWLNTAVLS